VCPSNQLCFHMVLGALDYNCLWLRGSIFHYSDTLLD
jgi:hypothetical protein